MSDKLRSFRISSPGKVILHGEHSVVYGKPALAAVVGLRTFLHFAENLSNVISFEFQSLKWSFTIDFNDVNELMKNCSGSDILKFVEHFVTKRLLLESDVEERKSKTLTSVLYLLTGIILESGKNQIHTGFKATISTELNIGSGLGSSASFGVCLATTFMVLCGQMALKADITPQILEKISLWAFNSERVMHGNPSGVDNTVCTYGGMVRFVKGQGFQSISSGTPTHILLVDTNVNRSTAKLVQKVGATREKFPLLMENVLNAMEQVVHEAVPLYESHSAQKIFDLGHLFQINNDLLKTIGVSHPKLECIFRLADANGFSSKLTGAGGGGYAIVLLPKGYTEMDKYKKLCTELIDEGFEISPTTVGGDGVKIEILN